MTKKHLTFVRAYIKIKARTKMEVLIEYKKNG